MLLDVSQRTFRNTVSAQHSADFLKQLVVMS